MPEKWDEIVDEMSRYLNLSPRKYDSFVKSHREQLLSGEISLLQLYQKATLTLSLQTTAGDILKKHMELYEESSRDRDAQIASLVGTLRRRYTVVYATNTEKEVEEFNRTRPDNFFNLFENGFTSIQMGMSKRNPEFFRKMLKEMHFLPDQVVFIDNERAYFESAQSVGIPSILYGSYKVGYHPLVAALKEKGVQIP